VFTGLVAHSSIDFASLIAELSLAWGVLLCAWGVRSSSDHNVRECEERASFWVHSRRLDLTYRRMPSFGPAYLPDLTITAVPPAASRLNGPRHISW
jgi:hypothetical protein